MKKNKAEQNFQWFYWKNWAVTYIEKNYQFNEPPPKKNRLNYAKLEYHKRESPTQHTNQPKTWDYIIERDVFGEYAQYRKEDKDHEMHLDKPIFGGEDEE